MKNTLICNRPCVLDKNAHVDTRTKKKQKNDPFAQMSVTPDTSKCSEGHRDGVIVGGSLHTHT